MMVENPQGQQHLRQCCQQLENIDQQCRCEAVRQVVRQQQQEQEGEEQGQQQMHAAGGSKGKELATKVQIGAPAMPDPSRLVLNERPRKSMCLRINYRRSCAEFWVTF